MKAYNPNSKKWENGVGEWVAYNHETALIQCKGFATQLSAMNWIEKHNQEDSNGYRTKITAEWFPTNIED